MFKWTSLGLSKNKYILGELEVTPIKNQVIETRLRQLGHEQKRSIGAASEEIDYLQVIGTSSERRIIEKKKERLYYKQTYYT